MDFDIADLVNIFYFIYSLIKQGIEFILEATIFNSNPSLAEKYADATSMLIPATAVWIILESASGLKNWVRIIVILGWVLLIASMMLSLT